MFFALFLCSNVKYEMKLNSKMIGCKDKKTYLCAVYE